MRDEIFKKNTTTSGSFRFDETVAEVFDDMLQRSIPFYGEILRMQVEIVLSFAQTGTRVYDLGCSTANLLHQVGQLVGTKSLILLGVDSSEAMIAKARVRLQSLPATVEHQLLCADMSAIPLENPSIVLLNFTLQFLPVKKRLEMLRKIQQALLPGGILLLSEKITSEHETFNQAFLQFYEEFKKRNQYTETEIAQKRKALENILIPVSLEQNLKWLKNAGFARQEIIFKWHNFVTLLAQKI